VIHPTQFNKDNVSGYLGIVEVDKEGVVDGKELLVTWVPEEILDRMDKEDKEGYKRVEKRLTMPKSAKDREEDGEWCVDIADASRLRLRVHTAAKGRKVCFLSTSIWSIQYSRLPSASTTRLDASQR
jgi:hypothetical protein